MKDRKYRIYLGFSMVFILITGVIDLYGLFHLPSEMATQISASGEQVNRMPTPIYMAVSFGIVLMLALFCITKEQEQKLKYLLVNALIVIANIVMIVIQL